VSFGWHLPASHTVSHQLSYAAQPGSCFAAASTDMVAGRQGAGGFIPLKLFNTWGLEPAQAYSELSCDSDTLSDSVNIVGSRICGTMHAPNRAPIKKGRGKN